MNARQRGALRDAAVLAVLSGLLFSIGLGRLPIHRIQEARVLEVAREMDASGDLIVPRFCGEVRLQKFPLAYWLSLAGFRLTGRIDEASGRIYSVVAGVLTVLLVYALGRRAGRPWLGIWAGIALSTAPLFYEFSRSAETDGLLALGTTAAFYCFWMAFEAPRGWRRIFQPSFHIWMVLAWIGIALAVMSKGLGGLLLPLVGILIYLAACRRWSDLPLVLHPLGLAVLAVLVLPWLLAVAREGSSALAVLEQEASKAVEGTGHGKEFLYGLVYYFRAFADLAPWSVLLLPAIPSAFRRMRSEPIFGFFLIWPAAILLQLLCIGNKQPHYFLPAFPALALLGAWWLGERAKRLRFLRQPRPVLVFATLAAVAAIASITYTYTKKQGKSCREFARTIQPVVGDLPIYFYCEPAPALCFYLERIIPSVGRDPTTIDGLLQKHRDFFLVAREVGKDGSTDQDAALERDPRFRLVHAASPPETPHILYRSAGEAKEEPKRP